MTTRCAEICPLLAVDAGTEIVHDNFCTCVCQLKRVLPADASRRSGDDRNATFA